jgi:hypothetical protein
VTIVLAVLVPATAIADTIFLSSYPFDPAEGEPEIDQWLKAPDAAEGDAYYLVQLAGPPSEDRKTRVASAGVELLAYVPDNTYIARMDPSVRSALASSPDVSWVGSYHPAYKLDPMIGKHEFRHPERAGDPDLTLTIRVFRDLEGTAAQISSIGGDVLESHDDGFQKLMVVHAAPTLLDAFARVSDVWWIEEKPEFYLMNNDTKWVVQSNISGSTPVWDKGIHGENEIAALMDSGIDYNSCWFRETGGAPPGPNHRKVISATTYGGNLYDGCDVGHGTHVSGTLCGDQSYVNPGNFDYNGMAYKAKMIMQDVGADDTWSCSIGTVAIPTSLTSAFNDAYNLGARVHSNSWGGSGNQYDSYAVNVDSYMWQHPDFLIVFAAGNAGPASGSVGYPGTAKNCITAGSTQRPPNQNTIASYSGRGPAFDSRYKPTVTAPGGETPNYINSADNHTGNPPAQTCNVASSPFQGTSMATPAIAGCALLSRQYYIEGWYPSGAKNPPDGFTPSAALMKATVVNSAADMGAANIPNNDEGWGRVLLDDALYFEGDARELIVEDVSPGVGQGGTESFEYTVDSGAVPLEIVLVWTDYPATSGCSVALQNNLNLTVHCPGGTTFKGNVFSGGQSTGGGSYDSRNVEEVVRLNSPPAGSYTIEVNGASVPHSPQPFALVTTGSFSNWPPSGTGVAEHGAALAGDRAFEFRGIVPNPFNPAAEIAYRLFPVETGKARAVLKVYSLDGRVVRTLVDRVQDPGDYTVIWDGRDGGGSEAASGIYFCELSYGGEMETRKMTLLK